MPKVEITEDMYEAGMAIAARRTGLTDPVRLRALVADLYASMVMADPERQHMIDIGDFDHGAMRHDS